jgi:hypothetical protein
MLSRFAIAETYAGQMEGSRASCSPRILQRLPERAARMLQTGAPLVILTPKAMPLPDWFCVAELKSMSTARSDDPVVGSWLCVAWFLDDLTLSVDAMIADIRPQLDWTNQAADFDLFRRSVANNSTMQHSTRHQHNNRTVTPSRYLPNAPPATLSILPGDPMSVTSAWSEFRRNLATCIAALEEDEILIISHTFSPHYVQFACLGRHGTRTEAASNAFIDAPEPALSEKQYQRMDRICWHRATFLPDTPLTEAIVTGSANFFADAPYQSDMKSLATMSVRAFREVYGVQHPGMLSYIAFHRDATSVRFPTRRLVRESSAAVTIRSGSIERDSPSRSNRVA